jgi:SPP1 family predicted phage head-tail adaptor
MRAGGLRKRLTLQQRVVTVDTFGQRAASFVDVATISGEITPLSGRTLISAQAAQSEVTHQITLRFRPELANPQAVAAMRVVYGTRYFKIHASINEEERNRQVTLLCSEGLTDGR